MLWCWHLHRLNFKFSRCTCKLPIIQVTKVEREQSIACHAFNIVLSASDPYP
ncbi:hypothetical protein BT96DRAFT_922268 [Gymnopus androsaceus JB14]|uniref:Uncharacterized protein n=1 Tax=Gymnopus androsaceus JB14 TaxID=1447944 RepID=A0A6A4HEE4_9AGAR|nr:hypothetical protein BT96DRAFT_922268 [Gymnopus androsaceus JB14]